MTTRRLLAWAALAVALVAWSVWARGGDALVVYCAHDATFADDVLRRFEAEHGVTVQVVYDTEATKSLALVDRIAREADASGCDVFWNNEVLGTLRLASAGRLEAYAGPGWRRMPDSIKDPSGLWTGFAARLRVWIVRPEAVAADLAAVDGFVAAARARGDLGRVALAKPLWGTTRSHYTLLWHALGGDAVRAWHEAWRGAGVVEASGNRRVAELVAGGRCDVGWTDTDDYFAERDAGRAVAMVPVEVGDRVAAIPNTVAIVRGTRRREAAERLVDYLLSAATEVALARSTSRQLPLGALADAQRDALPDEVRALLPYAARAVSWRELGEAPAECLDWLRGEYLR